MRAPRCLLFAAIAWLVCGALSRASLAELSPKRVTRLTLGPPPIGGVSRVDPLRSNRSPWSHPVRASVLWQGYVSGGCLGAVTDGNGQLVAASLLSTLEQLDSRGRLAWRAELPARAATAPAIGADGRRWLLTRTNRLLSFSPKGKRLSELSLPKGAQPRSADLLPLSNSELLVSVGNSALWVDEAGAVAARVVLEHRLLSTFERRGQVFLVDTHGGVYSWNGTRSPQKVWTLGRVRTSPALTQNGVWVWSDGQRVAGTSHSSQAAATWIAASGADIHSSVSLSGSLASVTEKGHSVLRGSPGRPSERIALGAKSRRPNPPLPPLGDPLGGLAVVGPQGRLQFVSTDGSVHTVEPAACAEAVALLPLDRGRVALVCSSGTVFGVGHVQ